MAQAVGGTFRYGMSWADTADKQFALNVLRWLSGALHCVSKGVFAGLRLGRSWVACRRGALDLAASCAARLPFVSTLPHANQRSNGNRCP
jgi:hypothetical protein